ncbi:MAG: response regulator [Gammaproteobacteria bacterium]|nr:response regulator [Gammaproteobacteria bacterium]
MRAFRDIPVKNKLSAIILLTSGIVLLLASLAFAGSELYAFRRSMVADLFAMADLVGITSGPGLLFDDTRLVDENLSALKVKPHILVTYVFSKNGEVFTSYFREGADPASLPVRTGSGTRYFNDKPLLKKGRIDDIFFFGDDYVEVFKHIVFDDEWLGTVYMQSDLDQLKERLWRAAGITFAILLASLLLAFLLASRLQKVVTTPIYNLLATMKTVSEDKNYTIREEKTSNDELGALIDGFNDMLVKIEVSNRELNEYHNTLEEKVTQRTAELAEARDQALAANEELAKARDLAVASGNELAIARDEALAANKELAQARDLAVAAGKELAIARDEALAANKAKSIFLANMSHEIRTPMNAVLGYTQILQRDNSITKSQHDTLKVIENSGNHLLGLINDILDISKIEAGAMELHLENFRFNELVDSIAAMFKIRCEQKGLNWQLISSIDEETVVYADEGKLRQILINLLGNAVKFTSAGGVTLHVAQANPASPPDVTALYKFDVIDTGQGIGPEALEKIFDPFQQEKAGFDKGGTGLGLAITKRQLGLMNGSVSVTSEFGKGSCFSAEIPLPDGHKGAISTENERPEISRIISEREMFALVVDDVKANRDVLTHMLQDIGITVDMATNGQEALDMIRRYKPDIVFSDIRMPVMDGMAFIRRVHEEFAHNKFPCIAISASTLRHQNQHVLDAGYDDFVAKPFRFDMVYDCLAKYLKVEFEYKTEEAPAEKEAKVEFEPGLTVLPKALFLRLQEAAEWSELTDLEEGIVELNTGDPQQHALADMIQSCLNNFDMDGILELLEKTNHAG